MDPLPSRRGALLLTLMALAVTTAASRVTHAQPLPVGSGPQSFEHARVAGDALVRVRTAWSARSGRSARTAVVTVALERPGVGPAARPFEIYRGAPVLAALAARAGGAVVVLFNGGAAGFVQVVTLDLAHPAADGAFPLRRRQVPRASSGGFAPAQAVATADGEGFTVLWQEHAATGPAGRAEARTMMARVAAGAEGADWLDAPREVAIPWSLAGVGWNGRDGYLLAINYDGARPGDTRLCLVELARDGRPLQHPWWASAPQRVTDVQVAPDGPASLAVFYRGGPTGTALRAVASSAVGNWGSEPAPPREHGAIASDAVYAVGTGIDGRAMVVRLASEGAARAGRR